MQRNELNVELIIPPPMSPQQVSLYPVFSIFGQDDVNKNIY